MSTRKNIIKRIDRILDTKSLCILIENSFIDQLDKVVLLGAVQELEQYRNNPFSNMQPCWKYVKQNGINAQLEQVREEAIEARFAQGLSSMALECFDVLQASITLMHILASKFNIDLFELVNIGQAKNDLRGYYKK